MLNNVELELITAAVDGVLTPVQQAAFDHLIQISDEARRCHKRLVADQTRLKSLPRALAPVSLHDAVMAQILPISPAISRPAPRPLSRRIAPFTIAALFLLTVGGLSYQLLAPQVGRNKTVAKVEKHPLPVEKPLVTEPEPGRGDREVAVLEVAPLPQPVPTPVAPMPQPNRVAESAPQPRNPGDFRTAPFNDNGNLNIDVIDVKLPVLLPMEELTNDAGQARLVPEFAKNPNQRIDLFTKDTVKAAEALIHAGKAAGVPITVDAFASDRIRRKIPTVWAVLSENLSPNDASALISRLATQSPDLFTYAHLIPLHGSDPKDADIRDIRELFRIDPLPSKPNKTGTARSISADTVDQIASTLRKGNADKSAFMLPYIPASSRVNFPISKDLKSYIEGRGEKKPGTVLLYIIIRPANG